ncbi:hypothetical protein [Candidatus Colwellia aromaticivorans]|uniref:hypothetical protein n=1 Tax=Candidatus Colwellia aromaticivorans TaxID=2267621 RepID=UPI000DF4886C|nr:hypothetical protein [Candidatus Colwellia aromaticivorans]
MDKDNLGPLASLEKISKVWKKLSLQNCISLAFVHTTSIQHSLAMRCIPSFGATFNTLTNAEEWTKQKIEEHIALEKQREFIEKI